MNTRPVVAIVQARMGSTRLPGKVLMQAVGKTLLEHQIRRIQAAKSLDAMVIATTDRPEDAAILELCGKLGVKSYAGSAHDVLDRYYHAAKGAGAATVVRLTADCPLLDPQVVDQTVNLYLAGADRLDYVCNFNPRTYPDGLDTEVFSFAALETAWREAGPGPDREHVTPYLRNHPERFRNGNLAQERDLGKLRWTVDYPEDFEFVRHVFEKLDGAGRTFTMQDVLDLVASEPWLEEINRARA